MKQLILPPLSYSYDALEPVISKETMQLHHDKHHAAYVNGANLAMEKLEEIRKDGVLNIREALRDLSFNYNGAKLHEIFWQNMREPKENNKAGGTLGDILNKNFGNFENLQKEFTQAAATVEGSGWAVLWEDDDKRLITSQLEKHNLLGLNGARPILVLDVWEHAYYLQYKNNRMEYVNKWWDVVNWDDVEKRLSK